MVRLRPSSCFYIVAQTARRRFFAFFLASRRLVQIEVIARALRRYIKSSGSFLTEQASLSLSATAEIMFASTARAERGQTETQRIHETHLPASVTEGSSALIACAGHLRAQRPQRTQPSPARGTSVPPPESSL